MTDILKTNYDEVISLGFNCFPKRYIERQRIAQTAIKYFDHVGTPCWAILELLKNDFRNLCDVKPIKINSNSDNKIYTNTQYYVRHPHYNFEDCFKDKTIESIKNRAQRFKDLLKTDKKVLFIRLEESMNNRIIYEEYSEFYKKTEGEYLTEISDWLKNNTKLKFKIIYLNNSKNYYDDEHNILYIKDDINTYEWSSSSSAINKIINEHREDLIKYGY